MVELLKDIGTAIPPDLLGTHIKLFQPPEILRKSLPMSEESFILRAALSRNHVTENTRPLSEDERIYLDNAAKTSFRVNSFIAQGDVVGSAMITYGYALAETIQQRNLAFLKQTGHLPEIDFRPAVKSLMEHGFSQQLPGITPALVEDALRRMHEARGALKTGKKDSLEKIMKLVQESPYVAPLLPAYIMAKNMAARVMDPESARRGNTVLLEELDLMTALTSHAETPPDVGYNYYVPPFEDRMAWSAATNMIHDFFLQDVASPAFAFGNHCLQSTTSLDYNTRTAVGSLLSLSDILPAYAGLDHGLETGTKSVWSSLEKVLKTPDTFEALTQLVKRYDLSKDNQNIDISLHKYPLYHVAARERFTALSELIFRYSNDPGSFVQVGTFLKQLAFKTNLIDDLLRLRVYPSVAFDAFCDEILKNDPRATVMYVRRPDDPFEKTIPSTVDIKPLSEVLAHDSPGMSIINWFRFNPKNQISFAAVFSHTNLKHINAYGPLPKSVLTEVQYIPLPVAEAAWKSHANLKLRTPGI